MILKLVLQQVVAAHAGLAGNARGDDHDVGVGRGRVVVGAGDGHVALLDGHGFQQVQRLALRHAFDHVDQDHIGQFLGRNPVRAVAPTLPAPTIETFFRIFSPLS